jgi:hypothetical protein
VARVYATRADLVGYAPPSVTVPDEPEATRVLTRASEDVDDALLTAVYDVDTAGMPTGAAVVEALKLATCAQAVHMLRTGTDDGDDGLTAYDSVSIGSITLSGRRDTNTTAGSTSDLDDEAARHLRRAGLGGVIYS